MWRSTITRDEFIGIAQREMPRNQAVRIESLLDLERLSKGLVVVWGEKPEDASLPNLLLMPQKEKRDFLAWANSYVKVKPITAFVRTLDFETLGRITLPLPNNDRWQRAIVGLILGEALTYIDQTTTKLSLRNCEGTYSFAVARSILRVEGLKGVTQTGQNWFRSREALGNRASRLSLFHLQGVWSVLEQLMSPVSEGSTTSQTIVRSCRDLFESGDISDADWRSLTKQTPLYDLRIVMQDTREERVRLLESFLKSIGSRTGDSEEMSFLIGYLVSMIAPGTLDHWRLLNPIRQSIPTAGIWYGLCAGLRPESRLDSYGTGIGRLIARELRRKIDLLDPPTCDIAVDELDVTGPFFKAEGSISTNTIQVEVSAGVSVPFRSNGAEQSSDFHLEPAPPKVNEPSLDPMILDSLDDAIYALQEVRRGIQKAIPYSERSFFSKSRKKRPGR